MDAALGARPATSASNTASSSVGDKGKECDPVFCDGTMLGLYTSQVDAWKVAKHIIGASMWRCTPNSDVCEVIDWK